MKLNSYEINSLKDIKRWEKEKHGGIHKKILDISSKPVNYLVQKIGHQKFHRIETAIEQTITRLLFASSYTVRREKLLKRARQHGVIMESLAELGTCDLQLLDNLNRKHIRFHKSAGTIQGAILGLGGAVLSTADLTTLLVQDFHMVQEIAYNHAFDPNDAIEKEIILRIIEVGFGSSQIKFKALKEIEALAKIQHVRGTVVVDQKGVSVLGAKTLQDSIQSITINILLRLMRRAVPIVTVVVSAHSNYEIMAYSSKIARMVYRKRFLERKREL